MKIEFDKQENKILLDVQVEKESSSGMMVVLFQHIINLTDMVSKMCQKMDIQRVLLEQIRDSIKKDEL